VDIAIFQTLNKIIFSLKAAHTSNQQVFHVF
jgi:hypothetical protein